MALSSSSSCCSSIQSVGGLQELDVGVVMTFHPTESELVGHYLYNKIFSAPIPGKPTFPEIDIYGKTGIPPWEIYTNYDKFPHQDYVYFFTHFRKLNPNGGGSRISRTVGSDGGTWSETEAAKAVYVTGIGEAVAKLRKFRYEKNKDKGFEHHAAWLMEEYTINQQPHLALCRIKANDRGRSNKKRKKTSSDENQQGKTKCSKKPRIEMPSQSHCEDDYQVVVVQVPDDENGVQAENDFCDELEQMLSDNADVENLKLAPTGLFDDIEALTDPNLMTSASQLLGIDDEHQQQQQQFSDCSLVPQQQLEVQLEEPSSSQLCGDDGGDLMAYGHCDFDIPLDVDYLQSDEFDGFYIDQDPPTAPEWLQSMDYSQQALFGSDLLFEVAPFPNQVL